MNQGFFHPIIFAEYGILKTTLYNDVDKDIKTLNLNYNPKFCLQLMQPKQMKDDDKKKNDKPSQYFYADFEADTTTITSLFTTLNYDDSL